LLVALAAVVNAGSGIIAAPERGETNPSLSEPSLVAQVAAEETHRERPPDEAAVEEAEEERDGAGVELESFQPRWKVGQSWIVETTTRQSQARRPVEDAPANRPVRWRFEVLRAEPFGGASCYVVGVTCLEAGRQPMTTLWVDRNTMTLRAVRTQLPAADGWRAIEETYTSSSEQPFPAFGPHSVPPLELPVFLPGIKGQASFRYRTDEGVGVKAVGKLGFAFDVRQSTRIAAEEELPAALPQRYAKSPRRQSTLEVTLRSATGRVRQFWQSGLPWPVFTDNGIVQSTLVTVEQPRNDAAPRAEKADDKKADTENADEDAAREDAAGRDADGQRAAGEEAQRETALNEDGNDGR
jgi:hypothetical protein